MNLPLPSPTPPSEFVVVGEHRADPSRLLLGADGRYYAYAPTDGQPSHVEVDESWALEDAAADELLD